MPIHEKTQEGLAISDNLVHGYINSFIHYSEPNFRVVENPLYECEEEDQSYQECKIENFNLTY